MQCISMRAVPTHSRAVFLVLVVAGLLSAQPGAAAPGTTPLRAVVSEALANNPEIQAARREHEAARQRIAPAGALDDPMLEAGVISLPINSLRFDREDMTMKMIGLSQRFPYPGKRGLRQEVAARDAESVGHGYQETVNRVARETKVAYFDLNLVIETRRLIGQNKLILEHFLRIAESRYAVGQGGQADVLKAQTQLSKMNDELLKIERERHMIEAELTRALGRPAGEPALLPEAPQLREAALPFDRMLQQALQERPQLRALRSVIARSERSVDLMRSESYPDFDVRFSYGQRDRMPDGARRPDMVNLTVAINLPVWRATKINPRIAEAQAMREQAQNMYDAMRNELGMKLRQQVAAAEQNLRSARLYERDILPQARLTVEAALAAYRVGRLELMTLLDNQMTVFDYEIAFVGAVANYNKALAEIDLLTGRSPTATN